MKIAILAWGSVYWDPRELPLERNKKHNIKWKTDGPVFKLEFSRISGDARLTLVIDEENGRESPTLYTFSTRNILEDAVADLRDREGTSCKQIGFLDLKNKISSKNKYPDQPDVYETIKEWATNKNIDGVIWTALQSNFEKEKNIIYTVDKAMEYINSLPKNVKKEAIKYINNAPEQIQTSFRSKFNSTGLRDK